MGLKKNNTQKGGKNKAGDTHLVIRILQHGPKVGIG